MPPDCPETGPALFEVILCFKNKSWLFSTCAYSSHSKAALEFAEKQFSVHALHHKLGNIKASFACVMDQLDDYYFAKRNGRWLISTHQARPMPNRTPGISLIQGQNGFCGSCG